MACFKAFMRRWAASSFAVVLCVAYPAGARDLAHPRAFVGHWQCHDALLGWDMDLMADGGALVHYDVEGARVSSRGHWLYEHERLVIEVGGERSHYAVQWSRERSTLILSGAELDDVELSFVRRGKPRPIESRADTPHAAPAPDLVGRWVNRRANEDRATTYTFRSNHTFTREQRRAETRSRNEGTWVFAGDTLELLFEDGRVERYRVRRDADRLELTRHTPQGDIITASFARTDAEVAWAPRTR